MTSHTASPERPREAAPGFVVGAHTVPLPAEEEQVLRQLHEEGVSEQELRLFAAELAMEAEIHQKAKESWQAARAASARGRQLTQEALHRPSPVVMLAGESIGWLPQTGPQSVPLERHEQDGTRYWFGTITDRSNVTAKAFAHLEKQGLAEKLTEQLTESVLPQFLKDLQAGRRNLRPISKGKRSAKKIDPEHSLDTEYPAYKLDVQGTNNRAIVLLPGKRETEGRQEQVVILAALYDHEDQEKITNSLFLKKLKKS